MLIAARNAILADGGEGIPHIYIPSNQAFNLSEPLSDTDIAAGLLGNNIDYASYSFDICVRMEGSPPTVADYSHGLFGPQGVNTFGKYFGVYGKFATWYRDPAHGYNLSSLIYDGGWHTINLKRGSVSVDGTSHTFASGSWPSSGLWQRFSVGAFSATTSPASVRHFKCYDGSNNLVFALEPTKDSNGHGAFRDAVSGIICVAYNQSHTMPTYVVENQV